METRKQHLESLLKRGEEFAVEQDEKEFFEELGERVALRRRELGLTQADVASALSCSAQVVAHYETGRRRLRASHLPDLSVILQLSVDEILGQTPTKSRRQTTQIEQKVQAIKQLPRGKQKMILSMLDAAIESART